jgi:hypothetical protein
LNRFPHKSGSEQIPFEALKNAQVDLEHFLSMLRFDSREKLKELPFNFGK